jgi:hypothetical protein
MVAAKRRTHDVTRAAWLMPRPSRLALWSGQRDVRPCRRGWLASDNCEVTPAQFPSARRRLSAHVPEVLLVLTGGCLTVGGLLHLAGAADAGDMAWVAGGTVGAAFSLWTMLSGLRRRRLVVDAIALLALVDALAVGEYLAAAVARVMVASGEALEGWAAGQFRRNGLRGLLCGLDAVLCLHTIQEDESYLSLADDTLAALTTTAGR